MQEERTRCHSISNVRWCPDDSEIKGVIQIVHGVTEYIHRYKEFAEFFTSKGFVVCGHDIRGHGLSINGAPMYLGDKGAWFECVEDVYQIYLKNKALNPDVPYIMMGFSMGSFMVRTALIKYPDMADAAIIMGTGQQDVISLGLAKFMANQEAKKHGYNATTEVIDKLTFGTYNKKFAPNETKFDWLCANKDALRKYLYDQNRGDSMTVGLFSEMVDGMAFTAKQKNIKKMKPYFPVLFVSGEDDPVGNYGKGVKKAAKAFRKAGMTNVRCKLYGGCRHDLLHEECYQNVYNDIYKWIKRVF